MNLKGLGLGGKGRLARLRPPHQKEYRARSRAVRQHPTPTQARSRLVKGENGPSDSALAAARGGRLTPPSRGSARGALRFSGPVLGREPLGAIRPRMYARRCALFRSAMPRVVQTEEQKSCRLIGTKIRLHAPQRRNGKRDCCCRKCRNETMSSSGNHRLSCIKSMCPSGVTLIEV